jgi:hypothetical protein
MSNDPRSCSTSSAERVSGSDICRQHAGRGTASEALDLVAEQLAIAKKALDRTADDPDRARATRTVAQDEAPQRGSADRSNVDWPRTELRPEQAPNDPATTISSTLRQAPDLRHLAVEAHELARDLVLDRMGDDAQRTQNANQMVERSSNPIVFEWHGTRAGTARQVFRQKEANDLFVDLFKRAPVQAKPLAKVNNARDIAPATLGLEATCFEVFLVVLDDGRDHAVRVISAQL